MNFFAFLRRGGRSTLMNFTGRIPMCHIRYSISEPVFYAKLNGLYRTSNFLNPNSKEEKQKGQITEQNNISDLPAN